MTTAPNIKRLVDLVDRGPEDDLFYPARSDNTIFYRKWPAYHNMVPEIREIGYQGNMSWGQRITVSLTRKDSGDLLQWLCLRLKPRSWLGADLDAKINSGLWSYANPDSTWMWAASLGSIAIQKVDFEIGDTLVESWPGEWMDIWSRTWMDGGRAGVWDSDIYAQRPPSVMRDGTRPPWSTIQPTEDGYVYCWLPLCFLKRSQTPFPLIAMADQQEIRVHITLRPFADLVRMRVIPRTSPCQVPLGQTITLLDESGPIAVPQTYLLPNVIPGFEETNIFVGITHLEDPLRSEYMRLPMEMTYDPVKHMRFDLPPGITESPGASITMNFPLRDFNGPIREICFFLRRKGVWRFNEWTNYGSRFEDELYSNGLVGQTQLVLAQQPILTEARLLVGSAVWRDETETWWRLEYGLNHRGGVRSAGGFVYGFVLGDAADWYAEDLQPAGTINASRADMRLDLTMQAPATNPFDLATYVSGWEVHVFGIGVNWMRFVQGQAVPVFGD